MNIQDIDTQIQIKNLELSKDSDPETKARISDEIRKLQLRKEIEQIKKRINQIK